VQEQDREPPPGGVDYFAAVHFMTVKSARFRC